MGFSQHAGVVIVCDGTPEAAKRIARVLRNDPGTGVMRHADAGYPSAVECGAQEPPGFANAEWLRDSQLETTTVTLTRSVSEGGPDALAYASG